MEEAVEEELWQVVMNLASAEEHEMETIMRLIDSNGEDIDKHLLVLGFLRNKRKMAVKHIMELRNTEMDGGEKFRTETGEMWCTIKHLLIVKMHLFETAQKYMALVEKTNDDRYIEKAKNVLKHAKEINEIIMDYINTVFPEKSK